MPAGENWDAVQVRQQLHDALKGMNPDKDWSFITSQIGMFSYTGMRCRLQNLAQR